MGSADHGPGLGDTPPVGQRPGDTKVHHLDRAALRNHHVGRFDVPVDDPAPMAEIQRGADVGHRLDGLLLVHRALGLDNVTQCPAVDELHHDIWQRTVGGLHLAGVIHRHDRGMFQGGSVLRLLAEAVLNLLIARQVGLQHFNGHLTAEPDIATPVHVGRAPVAEHLAQFVALRKQRRECPIWAFSAHSRALG